MCNSIHNLYRATNNTVDRMPESDEDRKCAIVWKLARSHGWSSEVDVHRLVDDANVTDKKRGRELARDELPNEPYIGFQPGKDRIWLDPPPGSDVMDFLQGTCGHNKIQVESTFDSYLDRLR